MSPSDNGLTHKQQRFVDALLLNGFNATQAYLSAGYLVKSEDVAQAAAARLLSNVKVAQAVAERKQQVAQKLEDEYNITADRIIREYARMAFSDPRQVMSWGPDGVRLRASDELTDDEAAAISEVVQTTTEKGGTMRVKMHDKKGALDSLAKISGLLEHERGGGDTFVGEIKVLLVRDWDPPKRPELHGS